MKVSRQTNQPALSSQKLYEGMGNLVVGPHYYRPPDQGEVGTFFRQLEEAAFWQVGLCLHGYPEPLLICGKGNIAWNKLYSRSSRS